MRQEAEQPLLDHRAAPGDAEHMIVDRQPGATQPPAQRRDDRTVGRHPMGFAREGAAQRANRLGGEADGTHPVGPANLDDQPRDGRMQMHVLVRVDMVERQAGRPERLELPADLGGEQAAHPRHQEIAQPGADLVVVEPPIRADQPTKLARRQHRAAIGEHDM